MVPVYRPSPADTWSCTIATTLIISADVAGSMKSWIDSAPGALRAHKMPLATRQIRSYDTCMMTQITNQSSLSRTRSKSPARTPRQAQRRRAAIDRLLDTDLFKALSDPTRAALLACVMKTGRACNVSEVAECCAVDFSVVARHLTQLAKVGVLSAEKKGRTMWYTPCCSDLSQRLRDLAVAVEEWCPSCEPADACSVPTGEDFVHLTTDGKGTQGKGRS